LKNKDTDQDQAAKDKGEDKSTRDRTPENSSGFSYTQQSAGSPSGEKGESKGNRENSDHTDKAECPHETNELRNKENKNDVDDDEDYDSDDISDDDDDDLQEGDQEKGPKVCKRNGLLVYCTWKLILLGIRCIFGILIFLNNEPEIEPRTTSNCQHGERGGNTGDTNRKPDKGTRCLPEKGCGH
jgi:hypothetical protein